MDCEVYSEELRYLGLGYPLYEPGPITYDRVRIGDVGLISQRGYFERIFNVFHDADDLINSEFGVPADFVPVDARYRQEVGLAGCSRDACFKSEHVQSLQVSASVDGQVYALSFFVRS